MRTFKVMQFNIQFGQTWDESDSPSPPIDLDLTIEEILAHDADIITLQEVEHAQEHGRQIEPPPNYSRISAALSQYHSYFAYPKADPRELPFGIGLAIYSKTPLRNTFRYDLPSPPIEFEFAGQKRTPTDRLLIGAQTTLHGQEVHIVNTHLLAHFMLNSSSEKFPEQRKLVIEQLRQVKSPSIVAGDFNVSNLNSLTQQFAAAGYRSVQEDKVTWRRCPYVLDHIFYSNHMRPLNHTVQPTTASDHHILVAEFAFQD